jgi:hypothetical protein
MESTGLSPEEFWQAFHACRGVRVAGSAPAYVQALLSHVLAVSHSPLAAKVARLPPAQMKALRDRIGQSQEGGYPCPAGTPVLGAMAPDEKATPVPTP